MSEHLSLWTFYPDATAGPAVLKIGDDLYYCNGLDIKHPMRADVSPTRRYESFLPDESGEMEVTLTFKIPVRQAAFLTQEMVASFEVVP